MEPSGLLGPVKDSVLTKGDAEICIIPVWNILRKNMMPAVGRYAFRASTVEEHRAWAGGGLPDALGRSPVLTGV